MRPEWLGPVFDAPGMAAADRWAIEVAGIPSLDLMETAGRGMAETASRMAGQGAVAVICGKGNNAGDGLVAARHLIEAGHEVRAYLLWPGSELSPDSRANLGRLPDGVAVELDDAAGPGLFDGFALVIDCLLGTGFSGEPREPVAAAIGAVNGSRCPVLACDLPSGVDGSTGATGLSVRADATVTFHGPKLGHVVMPGKARCGPVEVVDIGIPAGAPEAEAGALGPAVLDLLPRRGPESNKFSSGRVSVVGGSAGLTGAVCLAAEAAIRAGAGYATAAVPGGLERIFEVKLTEVMTTGVGGGAARELAPDAIGAILEHCFGADAVIVGSGLGRGARRGELIAALTLGITAPLVLDADGLSATGTALEPLRDRTGPTILTPHPGEMGRLLGVRSAAVEARRLDSARDLARDTGSVVVLKGDDTIVTDGERVAVNRLSAPGLATAGTGDVLAGVIGSLLARGLDPFTAACAAVYGHARAGGLAAEAAGSPDGVIASDVIAALPRALDPGDRVVG